MLGDSDVTLSVGYGSAGTFAPASSGHGHWPAVASRGLGRPALSLGAAGPEPKIPAPLSGRVGGGQSVESILAGLPEPFGGSVLGLAAGGGVFGDVWGPSIPGLPASLGGRGGRGEREDTDSKAGNTAPKVGRAPEGR